MYRALMTVTALLLAAPAAAIDLDTARWQELMAVSRATFALDEVHDGPRDHWQVAGPAGGDCEDKALFARAALLAKGWPAASLRLALAWTEAREYHAVLTIDVEHRGRPATYVIDGRFAWVLGWDTLSRFGYRWDRRQAARGPGWIRIAADGVRP